jgi:hypothetical protein
VRVDELSCGSKGKDEYHEPVVLKFSVVSTPLKFLRLVVYWTAR